MEVLHTFVQSISLVYIKGRVIVQYGYDMKFIQKSNFNVSALTAKNHMYTREIQALDTFIVHVQAIEGLILNFMQSSKYLTPFTYNCRPSVGYQEHLNYERFILFLSNHFAEEHEFFRCSQDCPSFDLSYTSDTTMMRCNGLMRDWKKYELTSHICVNRNSTQLFTKDIDKCPENDRRDTKPVLTADFFKCDTCYCTCDNVVAGVRLSKSRNTIYLSVLSGTPLPMGFVDTRNSKWFELPNNENPEKNRDKYFRVMWWCRTFVLSDVRLERYYLVTGVQFIINPRGFC